MNRMKLTDILSRKYLTAEIVNASRRAFWLPIKFPIGNYFIADVEHQLYVFEITDKIKTWYASRLTQSFRYISYSTSHYRPLSPEDTKQLEDVLVKNGLPNVNMKLFKLFKLLGDREKQNFVEHDVQAIINEIMEIQADNPEYAKNMILFLKSLKIEKIVTPVKKVADYVQEDVIAANPAFFGNLISAWKSADAVRKKVTNSAITDKKPWLKIIIIVAGIGLLAGIGWWIYSSGVWMNIVPTFGAPTSQDIMQKYPTPESLKAAVDRGEVDYDSLPPEVKKMVDSYKPPAFAN